MKNLNLIGTLLLSVALAAGMSGCSGPKTQVTPFPEVPTGGGQSAPPPAQTQNPSGGSPGLTPGGNVGATDITTARDKNLPFVDNGKYQFDGAEDIEKFKGDTILFDFDSAAIKPSEEAKLQEVAAFFKGNTSLQALIIQGNCDERGTEKYNLSLGERRALAAREYLANLGVDPARIKTMTFGASRPADPGHDESAWKKNRRDDFVLVTPK